MMTDNTYWQFPTNMVDAPLMMPQQPQQQPPQQQTHHQHQHSWSEDHDKRKWGQTFPDFDMNASANKMFSMDDYSNHSEGDSPDSTGASGGKRNDLDNSLFQGGDQKQRRKEQNRAAQRAFRERKEKYVKELQQKIKELEKKHQDELTRVNEENKSLKSLVKRMEAEIYTLKGAAMAFDVSINKLREAGLDVHSATSTNTTTRDHPSPPKSDKHSPDFLERRQHNSRESSLFDSLGRFNNSNNNSDYHAMSTDDDESDDIFAERETNRFEHKVDPIMTSGIKVIPCSQIWERLSQHPNFDEFDMDRLCETLKKKAKCSGTGPVIPEFELLEVLRKMDAGIA